MITSANKCKVVTLKLSSNKVTNSDLALFLFIQFIESRIINGTYELILILTNVCLVIFVPADKLMYI